MKEISYDELQVAIKDRVLVDFYSNSCVPCKMLAKVLEMTEVDLGVEVLKLNVDDYYEVAQEYKIMSLPTVILFDGEEKSRFTGLKQKGAIKAFVDGNKSHLTAISRTTSSAPINYLKEKGLLKGCLLDFGCGRGKDAEIFNMDKYDPYYHPELPKGNYDVITCTYVLNVIEDESERMRCIDEIKSLLVKGGSAYITVRRDIKKEGFTSRGTYQVNVVLELHSIRKTSSFEIYHLEN